MCKRAIGILPLFCASFIALRVVGAFLIPYFTCLFVAGIPLLILELGLGQFTEQGGVTLWGLIPIFKGIGYASVVIVALLNIYYIIIMAWSVYYLIMSCTKVLPWSNCNNEWNTEYCFVPGVDKLVNCTTENMTTTVANYADSMTTAEPCIDPEDRVSATVEFWERKILQIHLSTGLGDPGGINWQLLLCLALSWVMVYLCICKGVKSSGKVVYFTASFPYLLLTILLGRAVTLENASEGIIYYLKPDLARLGDSQVWMDAATQIFFSYSLGLGTMAALGSYNKYKHNFMRDAIIFSLTNSGTSIYSGFVIFSMLGFMAGTQGISVEKVATSGPGLVFEVYPEGLAQMPAAPFWSVCFFFMLILLGIDSQFVGVEGFITAIIDRWPGYFRVGYRREVFAALTCVGFFVVGISMVTYGGMYVFQLFDYYSASGSVLLWIAFCESCAIGWGYGADRLIKGFNEMSPWTLLNMYLSICWRFITPLFCMAIFLFSLIKYEPLTYNENYTYPPWGYAIGWLLALMSMIVPPTFLVYKLIFAAEGDLFERCKFLTTSILPERSPDGNPIVPVAVITNGPTAYELKEGEELPPSYGESTKF